MDWDDLRPKRLPYFKAIPIGECVIFKIGYSTYSGKIVRHLFPGFRFSNTNPWTLRYEIQDLNDKLHTWTLDYQLIKRVIKESDAKKFKPIHEKIEYPETQEVQELPKDIIGLNLSDLL